MRQPRGMASWKLLRNHLDSRIKVRGVERANFPLLLTQYFLSMEVKYVEDFMKEYSLVTHYRLTVDPQTNNGGLFADPAAILDEPLSLNATNIRRNTKIYLFSRF